jgi:hypothetical protein
MESESKQQWTLPEEKGVTNSTPGEALLPARKMYTLKKATYPCLPRRNDFYEENV